MKKVSMRVNDDLVIYSFSKKLLEHYEIHVSYKYGGRK